MLVPTFHANNDFPNSIEDITQELIVYPNPFSDILYLDNQEAVEVRNILGKLIFSSNGTNQIYTSDWGAGVYFVYLKSKKTALKVIKL